MRLIYRRIKRVKHDNQGFTLMELIVVLAIMAVLVGIAIPPMLRWVDRARESRMLVEARTVYISLESLLAEASLESDVSLITEDDIDLEELYELAGITDHGVVLEFEVRAISESQFRYEKDERAVILGDHGALEIEE